MYMTIFRSPGELDRGGVDDTSPLSNPWGLFLHISYVQKKKTNCFTTSCTKDSKEQHVAR